MSALFVALLVPFAVRPETPDSSDRPEVEVVCVDGSTIRLRVLDEAVGLVTRYGPLRIPVSRIMRVELATRLPPEVEAKITAAVRDLGHSDFKTRDRAVAELKAFKDRAYVALLRAAKSSDPEVARRAEELVIALQSRYSENQLRPREHDVIYTDDCKITGQLTTPSLRVLTGQFGEQTLRLVDAREIRTGNATPQTSAVAHATGNLMAYQGQAGAEMQLQVTGQRGGAVWGTDVYTLDSVLSAAAVHAGVVQPGQTATVKVRILPSPAQYVGSSRNGVTSTPFNVFPQGAYLFVR